MDHPIVVRDADASEIDALARVWYDAYRDAHEGPIEHDLHRSDQTRAYRNADSREAVHGKRCASLPSEGLPRSRHAHHSVERLRQRASMSLRKKYAATKERKLRVSYCPAEGIDGVLFTGTRFYPLLEIEDLLRQHRAAIER